MKKLIFMLIVALTAFALPAAAQFEAPKSGKECVEKLCGAFEGFAAVTGSVSDPSMLDKAYEPLIPLMENMTKQMKPYSDYQLDDDDKVAIKKSMMEMMTALNKFIGAPDSVLEQQVDVEVGKMKTLKDLINDAPGK